jgi:hypothetical protein
MSNEIRELPLEATIDEMADHEFDAASGGIGFEYGSIEWEYTKQKPHGTR